MSRKGRLDSVEASDESLPWWRQPGRGAMLSLLSLGLLAVFAITGLERLKTRIDVLPEYNQLPKIRLVDAPAWIDREKWRPQIMESIRVPERANLLRDSLVQNVGEQLKASGWVSEVKRVTLNVDGTVGVSCTYRQPMAMVRIREPETGGFLFVAIDKEGVRLPQKYKNVKNAGWIQILGVADRSSDAALPEVGQPFKGEDAVAAIRIAELLFVQEFSLQIVAVDVSNFQGRQDMRKDRIVVLARNIDDRVFSYPWGSPIGEEFYENTPLEKVRLISAQIKKGGSHVQAADVSIFPDRIIERIQPAISTADGSRVRDR